MCIQNCKFVALPVPEIIGGTQKILTVPGYAHASFSPRFPTYVVTEGRRMNRQTDNMQSQ